MIAGKQKVKFKKSIYFKLINYIIGLKANYHIILNN